MMNDFLKSLLFKTLNIVGYPAYRIRTLTKQNLIVIPNLHKISGTNNPYWRPLDPDLLEELIVFFKKNFDLTSFSAFDDNPTDRPKAVLSFDDGYYDYLENVVPLLRKHGVKANMNIIPESVTSGAPPWNIQLYDFLNWAPKSLLEKFPLRGLTHLRGMMLSEQKEKFGFALSVYLKQRPRKERLEIWEQMAPYIQRTPKQSTTRMLSLEEIKQLEDVTDVGVHSYSHESMGYESMEFFQQDTQMCEDFFQKNFQRSFNIYAFPNGSYRPEQVEYLKKKYSPYILLVDEKLATGTDHIFTRLTFHGKTREELYVRGVGFGSVGIQ